MDEVAKQLLTLELAIPGLYATALKLLTGIRFARTFCDAIAHQERVDVALQQARQSITAPLRGQYKEELKEQNSHLRELSLGQWCLPALISQQPQRTLINWDFTPQQPEKVKHWDRPENNICTSVILTPPSLTSNSLSP